ncbi:MAG: WecB/TagA/CpsF family glycosyltransferase [Lachnospiraceae bacterium]|nr:WecB/TagA/CpsF family glycosyltransferase [Lachnospiraceae bacterium]
MKVIDVLGMHITDYPIKEAIKHALKYIGNGAMNTIFYVSSPVLLEAGENPQQREWLESMDMLLYGEPTVLDVLGENTRERKNEIKQDAFLHEYIKKIARGKQRVYLILDSQEKADQLNEYLHDLHESVDVIGIYIWDEENSKAEDLVNELNDVSPDVIISKLPNLVQQKLICENRRMINASVWIALLHERVIKKKKVTFGSKLIRLFYMRLFKRKVNKYETEKTEVAQAEQKEADADGADGQAADAE